MLLLFGEANLEPNRCCIVVIVCIYCFVTMPGTKGEE